LEPKNALVWNELGNLYYNTGAHDEAMHSYQKSIEFDQGNKLSYCNMASIYIQKGCYAEAIPLLNKAIEFSDDTTETASLWNRLGDAYRRLADYDNALEAYRKADGLGPDIALPQSESPTIKPDPKVTPVDQIQAQPAAHLEPDPVNEEPLLPESSKPSFTSSPEDTLASETENTITTRPNTDCMDWWDGLASVMPVPSQSEETDITGSNPIGTQETDKAEKVPEMQFTPQENADESEPEAACQPGNTDEPSDPIENETCNSNELLPETPDSHILSELPVDDDDPPTLGQIQESAKKEEADPVLSNDEKDATMDQETAVTDNLPSQHSNVEDSGQNQVTINQENAQIWNELGNVYYNTGAFEEAMNAFEMAIELDPSCGWSYNNLASIYFHQKHYADAIPLYQKGLQLLHDYKDKALLWNRLGDTYRRLDEHDQAVAAYRKAMELDPDNVSLLTRARFSLLGNLRI
ncbi:MAG: tetratricopeptide repeat protein, partial [Anaerolineales bacterium]